MINKYRVHEVAKDFNVKSNIVIDLLAKYFNDTKKHMTALEEQELDVIFETFTQQKQVESFDAYFALANQKPEAPAAKAEASAEEKAPETNEADAPKGEKKPAEKTDGKKQEKPADKKPAQQPQNPPKQKPKKQNPAEAAAVAAAETAIMTK